VCGRCLQLPACLLGFQLRRRARNVAEAERIGTTVNADRTSSRSNRTSLVICAFSYHADLQRTESLLVPDTKYKFQAPKHLFIQCQEDRAVLRVLMGCLCTTWSGDQFNKV
jgi:hypothetical protein